MVGPFIFFDHAGPAELLIGQGVDVRPHPHIGLGTITYLYRDDFHHRDSTGAHQTSSPAIGRFGFHRFRRRQDGMPK
jgi:redox-sensitive bicupin YhaK (pirin superfamily)